MSAAASTPRSCAPSTCSTPSRRCCWRLRSPARWAPASSTPIVSLTIVFVPQITRVAERHHGRAQHGFRRGRARLRRRALHHHARAHARQRARPDLRLRDRPDLGVDDPRRRPVVPRPRHQAAGAGMGLDAEHAAHRDLRQSVGGGAARRDDLRGVDLLQPAQRRHAQRHGHRN